MSQQTLLADVATWGPDQCRKQLNQVLPKLVQCLNNAGSLDQETEIIQLICHSFVPVISPKQAEEVLFSKVVHKTAECVDIGLGEAERTAAQVTMPAGLSIQAASQRIIEIMQHCVKLIGCLTSCVSHVTPDEGQLEMTLVHSLPASVLHVIERSYSHCKESSPLYGELLASLSQQLSLIFRQANNLQVAFIGLLDKVHLGVDCTEQDAQDMVIAIHGLFEISQVAASLEVKVMLTLWKTISRLSCQHKEALCNRLELDQMVTCLCTDMSATYTYLFTLPNNKDGDNRNFMKTCKVLGFQMRILHLFIKEFDGHLGTGMKSVYNLILILQSKVPPTFSSQSCPTALLEEVERQVTAGVAPLIKSLTTDQEFAICVTQKEQNLPSDHRLPWLLTILAAMEQLPMTSDEVQSLWLEPVVHTEDTPRLGIFSALFVAVDLCYAELSAPIFLPGVMTNGKPQILVSLYEMLATRVSGFVACTAACHFHLIEEELLQNILSRSDLPALLATDIWSFIARYGTADVCRDHCLLVAHLIHQGALSPTPQCCHLVVLLRRLLRFMAPEHQEEFISTFPAAAHTELWSVIPLAIFTPTHIRSLLDQLVAMTTAEVEKWLKFSQKSVGDTRLMVTSLHILHNVCASAGVTDKHLTEAQRAHLVSLCRRLWDTTFPHQVVEYPPLQANATVLYRLSMSLVQHMDDKDILKILSTSSIFLSCDSPVSIKISILHFLGSIAKKRFTPPEEARVLTELPTLYRKLLLDSHVAVHQVALETFARFAEDTPHEATVSAAIQTNPCLQQAVVTYLNQEGCGDDTTPVEQLHSQAEQVEKAATTQSSSLYPAPSWSAPDHLRESVTQAPKRQRCDETDMDVGGRESDILLSTCLGDIRRGVSGLATARRNGPLPEQILEELNVIQMQLAELL